MRATPNQTMSNGATDDDYPAVPEWLDQSFLESALANYLDDKVVIESFSIEAATGKGENYASSMYRVKAIYLTTKQVKHIICTEIWCAMINHHHHARSYIFILCCLCCPFYV